MSVVTQGLPSAPDLPVAPAAICKRGLLFTTSLKEQKGTKREFSVYTGPGSAPTHQGPFGVFTTCTHI